jgi:hypothetical protein
MDISAADFDEWSAAWHANKMRRPNCTVAYKCIAQRTDGTPCEKAVKEGLRTCWNHRKALCAKGATMLQKKPATLSCE